MEKKKLVIFSEDDIYWDGETYLTGNPLTRLYAQLKNHFGEVILSGPVKKVQEGTNGYKEEAITYSARPYYGGSVMSFFKNLHKVIYSTWKNISQNVEKADIVMIRVPSPIALIVCLAAKRYNTTYFVYVAGNIEKVVGHGEKYSGFLKRFALVAASIFHRINKIICKNELSFVTGSELKQDFDKISGECIKIIPNLVKEKEINAPERTSLSSPIKLLYVGRLEPVKGLKYLFEALEGILAEGVDVELEVVGDGPDLTELIEKARRAGIEERVSFLGKVPFGTNLFNIYRQADIFVLPSLSEGIPKTLMEAMAFGLPIVSTDVGGIPDVVEDGKTGLLVKPRSPEKLSQAIEKIINNEGKREDLIKNGYSFAKKHTVEAQARKMWDKIVDYYKWKT